MARIIAGKAGSLSLDVPKSHTRPTSERVREAIFSSLESRGALEDARVLDLYAGSGALGLEALSRGARTLLCVESQPSACAVVRKNAGKVQAAIGSEGAVSVVAKTVSSFLSHNRQGFDLVFIDPPYSALNPQIVADLVALSGCLEPGAIVVIERSSRDVEITPPEGFTLLDSRNYGDTRVTTLERSR